MSLRPILVLYPSGETGETFLDTTPQKGDEMSHDGGRWIVDEVLDGEDGELVVKLRPVETDSASVGSQE